ncbi:DegQ family serine endoprotease [Rheinheimera salexigens]|uniref:Serine endoprotease DegQ n=1 Tax=Rheinheimera salexigens TaxID=1628148 RepID=A0A1E7Q378_9GAMM|nr:DegQ family serine endoprotease [Rheinheimera salexigens]OEY68607.1 serine endoprotease DegQ [Rheinheimera salexigens]
MNKKLSLVSAAIAAGLMLANPLPAEAKIPFFSSSEEIPTLAPMLEQATPAIVHISVEGSREVQQRIPEAFRYFFGQRGPNEQRQERPFKGLGSGVIIDADKGYIVTNNHVIEDADNIQIRLKDGRTFKAKKLGTDAQSDIALLQIEAQKLAQVPLANSDKLRVGDFAIAVGNPFGLEQTVTSGIISALGRGGLGIEGLEDFIQTDAAINSGNSGGALLNLRGELIGINTAILGPNGGNIGIGFAIPTNMMKNLVDQIIEYGEVRPGSLGIRGGDVTADLTEAMNLKVSRGAWVNEVIPDSPADKAGLKSGDVVISMNDNRISNFNELRAKVATLGAGKKAKLGILRDGKERSVTVTLGSLTEATVSANEMHPMLQGAALSNADKGVKVDTVEANSPAAQIGLMADDLIIGVNRQAIKNVSDLRKALENRNGIAALNIQRGNTNLYVLIR